MRAEDSGPFADIVPLEIKPGGSLGSLGLNLKPLLGDSTQNADTRFNRLEGAVIAMQEDLKTLAPSMQRLAVIEQDLDELVSQLEILLQEESGLPAPVSPVMETPVPQQQSYEPQSLVPETDADLASAVPTETPQPKPANILSENSEEISGTDDAAVVKTSLEKPAQEQQPAPAELQPPASLRATSLRLGEHADKTRIVIDLSGPVTYRHDLDNDEKILVIEMEKAAWSGPASQNVSSPLVQSWSTQAMEGGGTRLILVLKHDTSVMQASLLKPEGANTQFRLMVDLKK